MAGSDQKADRSPALSFGSALPVFTSSLRSVSHELLETLRGADALVVTVLAAGGTRPADASAGGDDDAWDVGSLAALDIPIVTGGDQAGHP